MEVGKLYSVKQYFWLLYPSKDTRYDYMIRDLEEEFKLS